MDLTRHKSIAERIAAAYALGTLRGGARRRFEQQARKHPELRALAITWQERFAAMTELQPEQQPGPNVWKRIALELSRQRQPLPSEAPRASSWKWRAVAMGATVATLAAVTLSALLFTQLQAAPEIRYVAMLSDDSSSRSVLVTFDPKHNTLTLKRIGEFNEGPDKSLQLWALPPGGTPQSLGVIPPGAVAKLTAAENQVQVPVLAISLEPKGGVPGDRGPTGPVLYTGRVVPTS